LLRDAAGRHACLQILHPVGGFRWQDGGFSFLGEFSSSPFIAQQTKWPREGLSENGHRNPASDNFRVPIRRK
jgi:hypothetical protein